MAKRYVEFKDLPNEGKYKPGGTMGGHHCVVVPQNGQKVVVGSVTGKVTLSEGDTLGYDCGTVWMVPRPDSYRDPIRRVLAECRVSQKVLSFSNEGIDYEVSWQETLPGSAADPNTGESIMVLGNHDKTIRGLTERSNAYRIVGGVAIIVLQVVGRETCHNRPTRVTRVVVRPSAPRVQVAEWLRNELKRN